MATVRVEIWSDIACPWCWVGKRHLEAASAEFDGDVEVVWRAFELDPSAPRDADPEVENVDRLARKYGVSQAQAQQMIDRMTSVGETVGLDFQFDRAQYTNTFDAHRLLHHAAKSGLQDALKERLFAAYMSQGRDIADHSTLVELAVEVGLDADQAQAALSTDTHAKDVREEEALAAELGVRGVPFFVVGNRYAVSGAQPAHVLREVLDKAAQDAKIEVVAGEAEACGPDGCEIPS